MRKLRLTEEVSSTARKSRQSRFRDAFLIADLHYDAILTTTFQGYLLGCLLVFWKLKFPSPNDASYLPKPVL